MEIRGRDFDIFLSVQKKKKKKKKNQQLWI